MRGQKYLVWKKKKKYTPEIAMSWKLLKQIRRSMNTLYGIALHEKKKEWIIQNTVILPTYYKTVEQAGKIQLEEI